jgi:nucleolar complex protein 3
VQVQRLALLSLSSVFKDILPGYRIRDLNEEEKVVKVTKAVQKLRDYEHALLRGFESYVKVLRSMLTPGKHSINHQRCHP